MKATRSVAILLIVPLFNIMPVKSLAQLPADLASLDSTGYMFILNNCFYSKQELTVTDPRLSADDTTVWQPVKETRFRNFGNAKKLWLRFKIANNDPTMKEFQLVLGNHIVKEVTLYKYGIGRLVPLSKTGTAFPFYQRPYPYPLFVFPQSIKKYGTDTFFIRIDPKGSYVQMSLLLLSKKELKKHELRLYLVFGIFTGIILLVSVFNLFLFFIMRERIHLFYFLYSLSALLLLLSLEGLDFQFLYPDNPLLYSISRACSLPLSASLLLFVMQEFLGQNSDNSRFNKPVLFFKWFFLGMALLEIILILLGGLEIVNRFYFPLHTVAVFAGFVIVIASCIEKIGQKFYLATFYLSAIACFVMAAIINFLNLSGVINFLPMPPTMLEIGIVLEAVIISFGILYRYNFFKKEKDKLEKIIIEKELDLSHQLISIQEAERKRIAEDLHDELGSSLAALKLRLQKTNIPDGALSGILAVVDKASEDTRNISHNLMPPEFEKTSLDNLLSNYYLKLNNDSGIRFLFYCSGQRLNLDKKKELIIYRILMELTGNIIKHSDAKEATIQLIYYDGRLEIMAEDNGHGIDNNESSGIGLKNIKSRVNYLNGTLHIDTGSHGTTIMIQLPT